MQHASQRVTFKFSICCLRRKGVGSAQGAAKPALITLEHLTQPMTLGTYMRDSSTTTKRGKGKRVEEILNNRTSIHKKRNCSLTYDVKSPASTFFTSAVTISFTSSSNRTVGVQPSFSFAFSGSPISSCEEEEEEEEEEEKEDQDRG
jgi:hypothetical protein